MTAPALLVSLGIVVGYVIITISESFFHRMIQHAPPGWRSRYRHFGWLGRALEHAWYSHHVVHHHQTFRRSHVVQFDEQSQQERLDAMLWSQHKADIIECRYGVVLGSRVSDYAKYMAPTLPVFSLACWLGGKWFTLGSLVPLIIWPLLAQLVHPYLHMRYEEIASSPWLPVRLLSRTGYFRNLVRHHWLHHRYGDCNYNLLLGGDVVLGVCRSASRDDVEAMRSIGLLPPPSAGAANGDIG